MYRAGLYTRPVHYGTSLATLRGYVSPSWDVIFLSQGCLMAFIWMIIVGAIVGALAKAIMPGRDPGGIIITIILGILGSLLGGWLFRMLGIGAADGNGRGGFIGLIGAIIGAIIILAIYRMIAGRRTDGTDTRV
jgi:uncharacterized membrane protein YeaQ/YmgE (transglycosylase-associated protein family)